MRFKTLIFVSIGTVFITTFWFTYNETIWKYHDVIREEQKFISEQQIIVEKLDIKKKEYVNKASKIDTTSTTISTTVTYRKPKVIIVWNDLFGKRNWGFKRNTVDAFKDMNCEETNCVVTDNKNDVSIADAVYFHLEILHPPTFRKPNQRWIFLSHEPPYAIHINPYKNLVNWTQTYKFDSDIYMPYGTYCLRKNPITIDFKSIVAKKTKRVAWFVSNCNSDSHRIKYVQELIKYIDVDVYGYCAKFFDQVNSCPRYGRGEACYKMIAQNYKFYLSFENCFHDNYITEKYYNLLNYNLIPVVRGDGNYSHAVIPNSYINTKDFDSPEELAKYLHFLDKNDDKYIEYLKYKEKYNGEQDNPFCKMNDAGYCLMCKKLNDASEPVKWYSNISQWYGQCRNATDIR